MLCTSWVLAISQRAHRCGWPLNVDMIHRVGKNPFRTPDLSSIKFMERLWSLITHVDFELMMMMIAFITIKSGLVPLVEGHCAEISFN